MKKLNKLFSRACVLSELDKKCTVDLDELTAIRDESWHMQQRAEAAEAKLKLKSEKLSDCEDALNKAEEKLAELEKQ